MTSDGGEASCARTVCRRNSVMASRTSLPSEQPFAFQNFHESRDRPHVGNDKFGNGNRPFGIEFLNQLSTSSDQLNYPVVAGRGIGVSARTICEPIWIYSPI